MTFKEFIQYASIILPILTGLGCFAFSIWNAYLVVKNRKIKSKLESIKYWIAAIDVKDFRPHDVRYINEVRKILDVV